MTWRQCPVGLGWIHSSAEVASTAVVEGCIQPGARVGDRTIVGRLSSVGPQAVIGARVIVEGRVTVEGQAIIGDWATLKEGATVRERAKVGVRANVGRGACLSAGVIVGEGAYVDADTVWHQSPIYIVGTKLPVFQPRRGFMQIACQSHELAWWEMHGIEFAKQSGFTPEQVSEYMAYLELFKG